MVLQDGFCEKCGEQYTNIFWKWCKSCQIKDFRGSSTSRTNRDEKIDNFIQEIQLAINEYNDIVFEWIPFNQFKDIKEISKDDCAMVYSAIWKDGPLYHNDNKKELIRVPGGKVALKCLYNSQNNTNEFLYKV
jgi:hypothetical protein